MTLAVRISQINITSVYGTISHQGNVLFGVHASSEESAVALLQSFIETYVYVTMGEEKQSEMEMLQEYLDRMKEKNKDV